MNMRIIPGLMLAVTGALLVLIPRHLFPTCGFAGLTETEKAARMICNTTGGITTWLGVLTVACALTLLFRKGGALGKGAFLLAGAAGVALFFIYTVWPGVCKAPTMPCRVGTLPAALLTAGVQVLAAAAGLRPVKGRNG